MSTKTSPLALNLHEVDWPQKLQHTKMPPWSSRQAESRKHEKVQHHLDIMRNLRIISSVLICISLLAILYFISIQVHLKNLHPLLAVLFDFIAIAVAIILLNLCTRSKKKQKIKDTDIDKKDNQNIEETTGEKIKFYFWMIIGLLVIFLTISDFLLRGPFVSWIIFIILYFFAFRD